VAFSQDVIAITLRTKSSEPSANNCAVRTGRSVWNKSFKKAGAFFVKETIDVRPHSHRSRLLSEKPVVSQINK